MKRENKIESTVNDLDITWKNVEGSERMILYNMYNTC